MEYTLLAAARTIHAPFLGTVLTVLVMVLAAVCAQAEKITITHFRTSDAKDQLILNILKLALEKSGEGQNYRYQEYPNYLTEDRVGSMISDGSLSVFWAGTQPKYEQDFYPIRIPILKGLLGHRIFIIRDGDQTRFDQVKTLDDLRRIPLGQGRAWGDTVILKYGGMKVVDPVRYTSLFPMLEGGRFDFFPRAVHEPWSEIASRPELNLTVEKNILLVYPFSMYFFVARDNIGLGQIIERGFNAAIDDGSFDHLFFSSPIIREALSKAKLKDRLVLRLENPDTTPETPLDDQRLWLNIQDL